MSDSLTPDSALGHSTAAGDRPAVFLVVVDSSPEMRVALRWASLRARRTGGRVGLVRVIRPSDFQHWAAVGNLMSAEAREEAEQLLQELGGVNYLIIFLTNLTTPIKRELLDIIT